ncbi:MAG: 2-phospho-L-lactate transferase [Acidimicrobiia bacterium]
MRITALSGGVGGARMLRGLATVDGIDLTAIVNVGDDDIIYGLNLSPDLDTVTYTLAGVHSEERGWGRTDESWNVMDELAGFPLDSTFRLGDRDLALNLYRTTRLDEGATLSAVTGEISKVFGIGSEVLPVSDDPIRTKVLVDGEWLDFQDYFVRRRHAVPVSDVRFAYVAEARPAPGVIEALSECEAVVIGPSNPILSIWPILAVPGIRETMAGKRVMAVSPLVGGDAIKGPLADLLPAFGYPTDTTGIITSYGDLLTDIVVHHGDAPDDPVVPAVHETNTLIADPNAATRLASEMISWLT